MKIIRFQNQPARPEYFKEEWKGTEWDLWTDPTISVSCEDPYWDEAVTNWLNGKSPTDSKEWKCGCFAIFRKE